MSNNLSSLNQDDIRLIVQELAEVKELLQESSRQLQRIDRQMKAAFPAVVASVRTARPAVKKMRLDEQAAQKVIADLKERVAKGEQIENELKGYLVKPDLQVVARILGMTNTKLPPKDQLIRQISTRLRQSVSVTTGFHEEAKRYGEKAS
jgi:hypothetical protein